MATRIVMPSFGMYTAEGTFDRWLVEGGTWVEAGDLVAAITTEKASYDIEAPADGVLHPLARSGDPLTVEGLIGWILAEGEEAPGEAIDAESAPAASPPVIARSAATKPSGGEATTAAELAASAPGAPVRLKVTPAARRLAAERGVDLAAVAGTGPGGRVVEADVLAAAERGAAPSVAPARPAPAAGAPLPPPHRVLRRIPLTGVRGAVATRLRRSLDSAVSLTLTREVRADALVAARAARRAELGDLSWDAIFVKLLADALRARPALNATVHGEEILVLDEVHVGFAVPMGDGLVVPVVRDADRRSLAEVAAAVRELGDRARAGALRPDDVLGGTATVSNLGAQGVDAFTPVLNPPQAVVLGVGRIAERAVVEDGRLAVGRTCVLSLTFDHRVTDGAPAAELLGDVAARIAAAELR